VSLARIRSFAFSGIEAVPVEVQVQISSGLPAFLVVGLPDKAVGEARERVRAALAAMEVLPRDEVAGYAALGELSLDGAIHAVAGVLPAAMSASARDLGLICPASQGGEAAWAGVE